MPRPYENRSIALWVLVKNARGPENKYISLLQSVLQGVNVNRRAVRCIVCLRSDYPLNVLHRPADRIGWQAEKLPNNSSLTSWCQVQHQGFYIQDYIYPSLHSTRLQLYSHFRDERSDHEKN